MGGIEAQSGFYYQNVLGAHRALDLIELGSPLVSRQDETQYTEYKEMQRRSSAT
jgi:hypothetical protein